MRSAMRWLEYISGAQFHQDQQLVRDQIQSASKEEKAKPKHAAPPPEEVVRGFEQQISTAPTAPLRCMAGMLTFLCHTSHRGLDGIRSRSIELTESALCRESLIKTSEEWTAWAVPRVGFSKTEWAEQWLGALHAAGLPGPDYIVNGINVAGSQ